VNILSQCFFFDIGEIINVGLRKKCEMCNPTCSEIQYYLECLDTTSCYRKYCVNLTKLNSRKMLGKLFGITLEITRYLEDSR